MDTSEKTAAVVFDSHVYSLNAVKKAAYKYLDTFSANISIDGNEIRCALTFLSQRAFITRDKCIDDFKKEVLDQDLREKLKLETEAVRNLILAHAFSKTGIVSNERVSED